MTSIEKELSKNVEKLLDLIRDGVGRDVRILAGMSERKKFWGRTRVFCFGVQMANGAWWSAPDPTPNPRNGDKVFITTYVRLLRQMTSWAQPDCKTCIGLWDGKRCIKLHTHDGYYWCKDAGLREGECRDMRQLNVYDENDKYRSNSDASDEYRWNSIDFKSLALENLIVGLSFDTALMGLIGGVEVGDEAGEIQADGAAIAEDEMHEETDEGHDHDDWNDHTDMPDTHD